MICNVCESEEAYREVDVPNLPGPFWTCAGCFNAGAIPYDLLVGLVYQNNGVIEPSWYSTASWHGITHAQFESDCANYINNMIDDIKVWLEENNLPPDLANDF